MLAKISKIIIVYFIDLLKAFATVGRTFLIKSFTIGTSNYQAITLLTSCPIKHTAIEWLVSQVSLYVLKECLRVWHQDLYYFQFTLITRVTTYNHAFYHFYADDTVFYFCYSSFMQAFESLHSAFNNVQSRLQTLKLILTETILNYKCS